MLECGPQPQPSVPGCLTGEHGSILDCPGASEGRLTESSVGQRFWGHHSDALGFLSDSHVCRALNPPVTIERVLGPKSAISWLCYLGWCFSLSEPLSRSNNAALGSLRTE